MIEASKNLVKLTDVQIEKLENLKNKYSRYEKILIDALENWKKDEFYAISESFNVFTNFSNTRKVFDILPVVILENKFDKPCYRVCLLGAAISYKSIISEKYNDFEYIISIIFNISINEVNEIICGFDNIDESNAYDDITKNAYNFGSDVRDIVFKTVKNQ